MYDYQLLQHKDTKRTIIATELDDENFELGYRFVKFLKNNEFDYVEFIANQQEEEDKNGNEEYVEHESKVYQYGPNVSLLKPHGRKCFENDSDIRYNSLTLDF